MNVLTKGVIVILVAACCTLSAVHAIDTTITLNGKIVAAACTIETRLTDGLEVNLGSAKNIQMQHPGDAGNWRSFTLKLFNCPLGTTKSTVTFIGTPDSDDATLFANTEPSATAASKVGVQMADDDDRTTVLSNTSTMTVNVDGNQQAIFPLAVRLYTPTGGVQAGKVSCQVLVSFTYQ